MIPRSIENDISALHCIQKNDEKALAGLMRKYYASLYHFGLIFTTNEDLVKRCIQDVFRNLWQKRLIAEEILSLQSFLFKSTRDNLKKCMDKNGDSNCI